MVQSHDTQHLRVPMSMLLFAQTACVPSLLPPRPQHDSRFSLDAIFFSVSPILESFCELGIAILSLLFVPRSIVFGTAQRSVAVALGITLEDHHSVGIKCLQQFDEFFYLHVQEFLLVDLFEIFKDTLQFGNVDLHELSGDGERHGVVDHAVQELALAMDGVLQIGDHSFQCHQVYSVFHG
jgi:hypothetical protein